MKPKSILILGGAALLAALIPAAPAADRARPEFFVPVDPPGAEYVLDARLTVDAEALHVSGSGEITLVNSSTRPISVLAFDWRIDQERSLEISAGGRRLSMANEALKLPLTTPLFVELSEPLAPGRKISVFVKFTDRFTIEDGGARLQRWYPALWWEGLPVREGFKVKVDAPAGWALATSGRLNPDTGRYENDFVTTQFGLVLSKTLRAATRESEGVALTAFFTEKGEACARLCLDTAVDIVSFYKKWTAAYPHKSLCIIPGDTGPWGGYPFASGIVVIHGEQTYDPAKGEKEQNWWKWITAHEIGHQYWGEYVMSADVRSHYTDSWLMIGLGIGMDKEYLKTRGLGWERHRGFIDTYLKGAKERNDTTMDAPPSLERAQKYDRNNVLIHGKGFAVQSALESVLGAVNYDAIYRRVLRDFAGKRLGWTAFRGICEEETREDLGWFFDSWVRSNKVLCARIAGQGTKPAGEGFVSEVRVEFDPKSIMMPVPVEAVFEDGTRQRAGTGRFARTSVVRFESRSRLKSAELDPERRLALLIDPIPPTADDLAYAVEMLDVTGTGESALAIFKNPETAGIKTADTWFRLGLLLYDGRHYPESFEAFRQCRELDASDRNLFGALAWMGIVRDVSGDRESAVSFYGEALKHDSGQTFQHDQYGLRINKAWIEDRLKVPYQRK